MATPPIAAAGIPMRLPIGLDGGVRLDARMEGPAPAPTLGGVRPDSAIEKSAGPSPFERLLFDSIEKTNDKLQIAEQAATDFATGKSDDIHGTMIAVTEADIQLRLVGSMRNKIIDAFNEIWRMQV